MKIFIVDNVFILAVVKTLEKYIVCILSYILLLQTPTQAWLVVEWWISVNNGLKLDLLIKPMFIHGQNVQRNGGRKLKFRFTQGLGIVSIQPPAIATKLLIRLIVWTYCLIPTYVSLTLNILYLCKPVWSFQTGLTRRTSHVQNSRIRHLINLLN